MNLLWQQWLQSTGAHIVDGLTCDFGDAAAELSATASGDVIADLSHLGVLDFTGVDAEAFLHGQLTCDVKAISSDACSLGSYCTPKGRMLATFLLWRIENGFRMVMARDIVPSMHKRLKMYVLRSKVEVSDRSDAVVLLGLAGSHAAGAAASIAASVPTGDYALCRTADQASIALLPVARYLVALAPERAVDVWKQLAPTLRPVGSPCWRWLDVCAGLPWVIARTQEQFLPQMANLELIGGVSFKKGCFPGQEVVARTQHLGKVKRRMYRARLGAPAHAPVPGDDLYSDDIPGQASGTVLDVQTAPGGGVDLLVVIHLSSREGSVVHVGSADGPALEFLDLPYAVA